MRKYETGRVLIVQGNKRSIHRLLGKPRNRCETQTQAKIILLCILSFTYSTLASTSGAHYYIMKSKSLGMKCVYLRPKNKTITKLCKFAEHFKLELIQKNSNLNDNMHFRHMISCDLTVNISLFFFLTKHAKYTDITLTCKLHPSAC